MDTEFSRVKRAKNGFSWVLLAISSVAFFTLVWFIQVLDQMMTQS
jgi:lipid-A-disaccharide synthase-like uncharacterized protein